MKKNFVFWGGFFFQLILFVFISNKVFSQNILQLISPSGGEVFQVGTYQGIAWGSKDIDKIKISYSIDSGKNWKLIFNNVPSELRTVSWKIPNLPGKKFFIKIEDSKGKIQDISKSYFTVTTNNLFNQALGKMDSKNNEPIFIMPLGNSITYGITDNSLSVGDKKGYRYFLYDSLSNAGYDFIFTGSEHSGWNYLPPNYDNNAGFPGIKDHQLAYLLETGIKQLSASVIDTITDGPYLNTYPADIILLHIGTNGNNETGGESPWDVEDILNDIDNYESSSGRHVAVILARIINRAHNQPYVTVFNDSVEAMALDRVNNPANPHYPDDIKIVDMENIPGFNYSIDSGGTIGDGIPGDMAGELHPNEKGYRKMANVWYSAIKEVLGAPPEITQQPISHGVFEGEEVNFSVLVADTNGIKFQWYKNNTIINGAVASSYVINSVSLLENESKFKCKVYNNFASIYTDEVSLFVTGQNEKVLSGIQTRYEFTEGSGKNVYDISGVGPQLDLTISDTTKVEWNHFGLEINSGVSIVASSSPLKIFNSCIESNEITIETWLKPSLLEQYGPARIITYSKNKDERNFTLSQDSSSFQTRLRTLATNSNGKPSLNSNNFSDLSVKHVVYTHDKTGHSKFFINGQEVSSANLSGTFSNWNSSYSFGIGNEFVDHRPWKGTIFYAAVFSRALTPVEILHNYNLGIDGVTNIAAPDNISATVIESYSDVDLMWEDNSTVENGFIIEGRPANNDSSFTLVDTVGANVTSYRDTTKKDFANYQYRIFAFSDFVKSEPSDTVTLNLVSINTTEKPKIPKEFGLLQNYPNPFNPTTTIRYSIPVASNIKLTIYNSLGQKISNLVNRFQSPGNYKVILNATDWGSGIYFYSINAYSVNNKLRYKKVKKLLLLK